MRYLKCQKAIRPIFSSCIFHPYMYLFSLDIISLMPAVCNMGGRYNGYPVLNTGYPFFHLSAVLDRRRQESFSSHPQVLPGDGKEPKLLSMQESLFRISLPHPQSFLVSLPHPQSLLFLPHLDILSGGQESPDLPLLPQQHNNSNKIKQLFMAFQLLYAMLYLMCFGIKGDYNIFLRI